MKARAAERERDLIVQSLTLSYWSFVEKTSVKQDPKPQVCSNFLMSFLHLRQMDPPKSGTNLGLVDLSSDVPPGRGIYWPKAVLHQVSLTFGQPLGQTDLQSDVPPM